MGRDVGRPGYNPINRAEDLKNLFSDGCYRRQLIQKFSRPLKSDVFTMLYFLSEVFRRKEAVSKFLELCFERMKKGALLVVLDFDDSDLESWIDACAENGGLTALEDIDNHRITMEPSEEKDALKKYTDKFGGSPKLAAQVFILVFRKD